jgi:hypothetical protein
MIGDNLRMLERSAILEISGYPGRTKGVATSRVGQGAGLSPALDHVEHVEPRNGFFIKPLAFNRLAAVSRLTAMAQVPRAIEAP